MMTSEEALPPARDRLPTLPEDLADYALLSSLPDADDELIFSAGSAGPALSEMTERVPRISATADVRAGLSHREALLLSLIDGLCPVSMVLDLAGTDRDETMVMLCDLYARGFVAFD